MAGFPTVIAERTLVGAAPNVSLPSNAVQGDGTAALPSPCADADEKRDGELQRRKSSLLAEAVEIQGIQVTAGSPLG